ncbi:hypothetical protein GQ457_14G019590 [Hibiscus cannabinus]
MHDSKLEDIRNATSFKSGKLPVRYLGVPLVTKKLTEKDCAPLLKKLKAKLHSWPNRNLSYEGRLQLIKYVLFSLANFWCRQLVMPKSVGNRIEQTCNRFFWRGNGTASRGARVGWGQVCTLTSEGGLGLKNIGCWNRANLLMLIQNILTQNDSLWVVWLNAHVFKDASY